MVWGWCSFSASSDIHTIYSTYYQKKTFFSLSPSTTNFFLYTSQLLVFEKSTNSGIPGTSCRKAAVSFKHPKNQRLIGTEILTPGYLLFLDFKKRRFMILHIGTLRSVVFAMIPPILYLLVLDWVIDIGQG